MFIRVKTSENNDVNLNVNHIRRFDRNADNTSTVVFTDGSSLSVLTSTQSLRGYAKKAINPASAPTEEPSEA